MTPIVEETATVGTESQLRLHLDNTWSVYKLAKYMHALDYLYEVEKYLFLAGPGRNSIHPVYSGQVAFARYELKPALLDESIADKQQEKRRRVIESREEPFLSRLKSRRIRLESPGAHDIAGFSGILQQLKEILFYYLPNRYDRQREVMLQVDLQIKQQEYLRLKLQLLKDAGYTIEEARIILDKSERHLNILQDLVYDGHIVDIEEIS